MTKYKCIKLSEKCEKDIKFCNDKEKLKYLKKIIIFYKIIEEFCEKFMIKDLIKTKFNPNDYCNENDVSIITFNGNNEYIDYNYYLKLNNGHIVKLIENLIIGGHYVGETYEGEYYDNNYERHIDDSFFYEEIKKEKDKIYKLFESRKFLNDLEHKKQKYIYNLILKIKKINKTILQFKKQLGNINV